jgi:RNA polymerase sigma factor (sigma-70 family)
MTSRRTLQPRSQILYTRRSRSTTREISSFLPFLSHNRRLGPNLGRSLRRHERRVVCAWPTFAGRAGEGRSLARSSLSPGSRNHDRRYPENPLGRSFQKKRTRNGTSLTFNPSSLRIHSVDPSSDQRVSISPRVDAAQRCYLTSKGTASTGRVAGRSGRGRSSARVNHLDPETLGRVQSFLDARANRRTTETSSNDAWEQFFAACEPLVQRLASRKCIRLSHDDEDRVQEVWRVLVVHLAQYDPQRKSFPTWLARVVRNALATHDRCNHASCHLDAEIEWQLPGREADPPTLYEQCQTRQEIASAMDALRSKIPEVAYRIAYAHWIEEKSFAEIATSLDLPVKQVRDRHCRVLERFRRILSRSK